MIESDREAGWSGGVLFEVRDWASLGKRQGIEY